jgi:asparagine synthase (glutamine-hydrolysing)
MCGICGVFDRGGSPVTAALVERMNDAIRHRGPDGDGLFVDGPIGLGHRRLSIIDLSETGRQPMSNGDGTTWITYNGEMYNYRELRAELLSLGWTFRSTSDTEVLLRAYEQWGPACLERVRGMFAFAIWDGRQRTLFLARDRIGIKPLYYHLTDAALLFASEIKALLRSPVVPRAVDPVGLNNYLTFGHSVGSDTMYAGIRKLPPGHHLLCTADRTQIVKYWDLGAVAQRRGAREEECAEEVRERLADAVRCHMVSDVPVGAFLSGGIDSSAIVAMMSRFSDRPIQTFAAGFDVGGRYDELADARLVARRFGTDHHELVVGQLDVRALIERLVYAYDEPFADAANLPTLIIAEFARRHVKVVLSGDGGDEVFGGYRRYSAERASRYYQLIPAFLREHLVRRLAGRRRWHRVHKAIEAMSVPEPDVRYGTWLTVFSDEAKAELLDGAFERGAGLDSFRAYREHYNRPEGWDLVNRMLYTDLKTWLPDTYLEKLDKATMAVGLEGRVPFLDHLLVECVASMPGRLKIRRLTTKHILKQALEGLVPHEVLHKPKHGFSVPLDEWFRGELKPLVADVLLDERTRTRGFFDPAAIERILTTHASGAASFGTQLWTLLNFELWCRRFIDGPAPAVPS